MIVNPITAIAKITIANLDCVIFPLTFIFFHKIILSNINFFSKFKPQRQFSRKSCFLEYIGVT